MRNDTSRSSSSRRSLFSSTLVLAFLLCLILPLSAARAQLTSGGDVNTSKMPHYQNECSIIKNPTPGSQQLFAACNNATGGIFATRSTDHGATWTYPDAVDKTIADGDVGQGPLACCDPTLAWDTFGNLYVGYLGNSSVVLLLSTDGGLTFSTLMTWAGSVDQPTVVAANTSAPGAPVAVWMVWNQSGSMRAAGAAVTGLGTVGAFGAVQTIPGTTNCSFGDVAIAPSGVVVQTCQTPTGGQGPGSILINRDLDGLGPNNFGAAITATTTNVGGFDFIPAQNVRSIDAEAGLAYDHYPGTIATPNPRFGRLYLVYTDETVNENNNTNILLRFSNDDGATWSAPQTVNTDATTRSQFLPRIASNRLSGNIAVCWHDARNSGTNTTMQEFCDIATPATSPPVFIGNHQVGDALTSGNGSNPPAAGQLNIEFGDYSGLTYFQGRVHPIWADVSNSTGDNPDGTFRFDAYTDLVMGGAAANEGDPHIRTVDNVHYDFQGGGEYTILLDSDGSEIQARYAPVATNFMVGPNGHTGLTTCASLTTAVAAQVGDHRVTYQPNLSGVPDPSGLQLRVDGVLTTLGPAGLNLSGGGRINKTAVAGGIEVQFPNGMHMIVTPGWWASQSQWYLNVNVARTTALEGIMGDVQDGWLPRLSNGTSIGPKPASLATRYADLYQRFGDSWRVTTASSLFDYASGQSTNTFTYASWPPETLPCEVPAQKPLEVEYDPERAKAECEEAGIVDEERMNNCVFDVALTGEREFAKTYELTQKLLAGATMTTLAPVKPTRPGEAATFNVVVERKVPARGERPPAGTIVFSLDGKEIDKADLDARGRATWTVTLEAPGDHVLIATYIPAPGSSLLPSSSGEVTHTVVEDKPVEGTTTTSSSSRQ